MPLMKIALNTCQQVDKRIPGLKGFYFLRHPDIEDQFQLLQDICVKGM